MSAVIRRRAGCLLLSLIVSVVVRPALGAEQERAQAAQPEGEAQEATMALWQERDVNFLYRSPVVTHSCQDLRYRVASVLVAVGARPDIQVSADNCDAVIMPEQNSHEPWRPSSRFDPTPRFEMDRYGDRNFNREGQNSHVRIHLTIPVPVTREAVEDWKKEKSRRELIARVTGDPRPILETTGQFPAQWQTVTLTHRTADLEPEDCALLEQLSSNVMRQLNVRKVRMSGHCDPREPSRIAPQLTVEALMSNPYGSVAPPGQNESEDDAQPAAQPSDAPSTEPPTTPSK